MKKIKIVTVYGSYNHGSYLQSLCLYQVLGPYGEVSFVDTKTRKWNILSTPFKRIKHNIRLNIKNPYKVLQIIAFEYVEAFKSKFCWSKFRSSENTNCDICVLGSDEIWNIKRKECSFPIYYGKGVEAKTIAYAPSVNNAKAEDFIGHPQYLEWLNNIDAISVRDIKSKNVLSKFISKPIEVVLDPTLLVSPVREKFNYGKKYIAVYSFDGQISVDDQCEIKKIAKEKNMDLVAVGQNISWCDKSIHSINGNPFYVYENADFIITSTFHGTAYAINYRKDFVSISNNNDKIEELLKQFGLENRLVHSAKGINKLLNVKIDYLPVIRRHEELRMKSLDYITKNVAQCGLD